MSVRLQRPRTQPEESGFEHAMMPQADCTPRSGGAGRLVGKVALITGGDSGIGRAVAIAMAREGADIAFVHLDEHADARETARLIEAEGRAALAINGDIGYEAQCAQAVGAALDEHGQLDILVNNAAEQHEVDGIEDLTAEQLERTFRTNVFSYVFMIKAAMPYLGRGAVIINTTSITAYQGHATLIDDAATRGAIVALTRSLARRYVGQGIRVNAVAPGPVWTPLINPASFSGERVAQQGSNAPMGRAGQPNEVAPAYVFLASDDASYMTGQVLHPNGGTIVGS